MNTTIVLNESMLNEPLRPIFAGRLSAHYLTIRRVPDYITRLSVVIHYLDDDGNDARYAAQCERDDVHAGVWTCYVIPAAFPNVSAGGLEYDVLGWNAINDPVWLGSGRLFVLACPAEGGGELPSIIPADTYIRNPTTGLYHRLTADTNEYGEIVLTLESEGVNK